MTTITRPSWLSALFLLYFIGNGSIVDAMNKMPPQVARLYHGFSRSCPAGGNDCKFSSPDSQGAVLYFKCKENNICFCSRGAAPADALVWPVQWEDEECRVGKGGPCGEDNGMVVNCSTDLLCVHGRCRNSSEIHNGQLNQFCNDDIDCQSGLLCKQPVPNMEIKIKRCMQL